MTPHVPQPPAPDGDPDLLGRAAAGQDLTVQEADDVLEYYLANGRLPGHDKPTKLTLTLGAGDSARPFPAAVRRILWEEHQASIKFATDADDRSVDNVALAASNVGFACVRPNFVGTFERQQAEARVSEDKKIDGFDVEGNPTRVDPPKNVAHLVRRVFADEPGAVLELNGKILELSKLANSSSPSVRETKEVEAGKG